MASESEKEENEEETPTNATSIMDGRMNMNATMNATSAAAEMNRPAVGDSSKDDGVTMMGGDGEDN